MKGKRSNRERLMRGTPNDRLIGDQVWAVLEAAEGRCPHCGSLAVENRPSKPNDAPAPCESVGRRIDSRVHVVAQFNSGANTPDNLAWSCLRCNTRPNERQPGATDHAAARQP
jgi:hypothetical protein